MSTHGDRNVARAASDASASRWTLDRLVATVGGLCGRAIRGAGRRLDREVREGAELKVIVDYDILREASRDTGRDAGVNPKYRSTSCDGAPRTSTSSNGAAAMTSSEQERERERERAYQELPRRAC